LAETAEEEGIDLSKSPVKRLIVAGEPGGSVKAVREQISQRWGKARVFDHHGMTETGPVTYECPKEAGVLHVIESAYFAEVIEPASGKSAANGEPGELVLTTLGRIGMPLLRYRTGDLVKARAQEGPCGCGRHEMALEGGIIGRTDDMVVVKGVNIFPTAIEEIVRSCGGISEYQVEVDKTGTLPEIRLKVEAEGEDALRLGRKLETALGMRVPVIVVERGTLPRFEMKAKRWMVK
jgi:phenylacetate-CoA ligase